MRTLLVYGHKTFKINVPDDARLTFGPWSPPSDKSSRYGASETALKGTLRVYDGPKATASVLAVFSGVTGYRDMSIDYQEEVAREEGAIIWKSDKDGYSREEKVQRGADWLDPQLEAGGEE